MYCVDFLSGPRTNSAFGSNIEFVQYRTRDCRKTGEKTSRTSAKCEPLQGWATQKQRKHGPDVQALFSSHVPSYILTRPFYHACKEETKGSKEIKLLETTVFASKLRIFRCTFHQFLRLE